MSDIQLPDLKRKLKDFFSEDARIQAAYLFGSLVRDEQNFQSDIDIAVYVDTSFLIKNSKNELMLELIAELTKILQIEQFDLVLLNTAPIILAYRIIAEGVVVYSENEDQRADMESLIVRKYLDFKYYSEEYDRCLRKRIKQSTAN